MERTVFIKKLKSLKLVAHRLGYEMTGYPENSIIVLEEIFKNEEMLNSCAGFEFDICFTKDNIPVVIHDKYIDDISDGIGLVKSYSIDELRKMNFSFRKSLSNDNQNLYQFKIVTLEEILKFFDSYYELLGDKIIKIETKEAYKLNKKNLESLADIISKFTNLSDNIIHLSFWPQNLSTFRKIQLQRGYTTIKCDLLTDYKIIADMSKLMKSLDYISFRIKTSNFPKTKRENSKRVNRKIFNDIFFMRFSDAISKQTLEYAIKRFGIVNFYVLNGYEEIDELSKKMDEQFFEKYYDKMFFTTDNPLYLKKLEKK